MHDLLMRRATVVTQIGALGVKGRVAHRPGREAAILRRLLGRHTGRLPPQYLMMIWRELISGMTTIQGAFTLAVCDTGTTGEFAAAAREHFGALTPLKIYRTAAQAIRELSAGHASAAILPLPGDDEPAGAAWWTALLHRDEPRIHVTARLPFWSPRPEGAPKVQAFLATTAAPDPSGQDRSLLGLEVTLELSRQRLAQALATAGFEAGATVLRRDAGAPTALVMVDVAGFVTEDDARLAALPTLRKPVVLGAYAVPVAPGADAGL